MGVYFSPSYFFKGFILAPLGLNSMLLSDSGAQHAV